MKTKSLIVVSVMVGLFVVVNDVIACGGGPSYPTSRITANPTCVVVNGTVSFDGSASTANSGSITEYRWDFGDGSEYAYGAVVTHQYADPCESYIVELRVKNSYNLYDTETCEISVGPVYYVSTEGSDSNDGLSWPTAFATIQHAIDVAVDCSVIIVAEGAYTGAGNSGIDFEGKAITVQSTDPNNWNVVEATVIDANNSDANAVTFNSSENQYSILKGFTITGAARGIYCEGSSPTISHCIIRDNDTDGLGGGMYNLESSPTVSNCFFNENSAGYGGSIYDINSSPIFLNCVIADNIADANGGGIYNEGSFSHLINCTFKGNTAVTGGGIYNHESTMLMTNCVVWDNVADFEESIYNCGLGNPPDANLVGWWELDETSETTAYDSEGSNNGTLYGNPQWVTGQLLGALGLDGDGDYVRIPAIYLGDFTVTFWVKTVQDPRDGSQWWSGNGLVDAEKCGVLNDWGTALIDNGKVAFGIGNPDTTIKSTSTVNDGVWHFVAVTREQTSGQMKLYIDGMSEASGTANTNVLSGIDYIGIGNNWCNVNSDVGWFDGTIDDVHIYNKALSENEVRSLTKGISYSDIEGCGGSGSGWDPNFGTDGGGNIDSDPNFMTDDYHLGYNSQCINAGDPNGNYMGQTDIDGDPRVRDSRVDIGADEVSMVSNITKGKGYECIQAAIDDASNGDIIEALPRTYNETIDFEGKSVTLRSTDPNDWTVTTATVINGDANTTKAVVTFDQSGNNAVLQGFTVTNGKKGGIKCSGASPLIRNCVIRNNRNNTRGGGMYNINSSPTVTNCFFVSNVSDANNGGGMSNINSSSPMIKNCVFVTNYSGNYGGGIDNLNSSPVIVNCTFARNTSKNLGGGMYNGAGSYPVITNCIFWGDKYGETPNEIYPGNLATVTYCDVQSGYSGSTNISGDPKFADMYTPAGDDRIFGTWDDGLRIMPYGVCIDNANGNATGFELTDITGRTRVDVPYVANGNYGIPGYADRGAYESPTIWFVNGNITTAGDGKAWDNTKALKKLQDALAKAKDGNEVWVAGNNTYEPNSSGDRSASFQMVEGVAIYGGFAGTATAVQRQDWTAYQTVLSGDIGTLSDINDNSYHVVKGANNAILSGFTVRAGNACVAAPDVNSYGGGIYCDGVSPTIINCVIADNNSTGRGGGMYCNSCSPVVRDCFFVDNTCLSNGGGIYNNSASTKFTNCVFSSNGSDKGGGIYNYSCLPVLINCTFVKNTANNASGGGAIYNSSADPQVTNCILWDDEGGNYDEICNADGSNPRFSYCDVEGCGGSNNWNLSLGTDAGGNKDSDPHFADIDDPNGPNHILGTSDDGLGLTAGSPCIDAGDNTSVNVLFDIACNTRIVDDPCTTDTGRGAAPIVDMGAYEYGASIIYVDDSANGRNDGSSWTDAFNNVQDGIDAAKHGQTVLVAQGTYYEKYVSFNGKQIHVKSTDPNDPNVVAATIINANDKSIGSVVKFFTGEDSNSVLEGITIKRGYCGIYCYGSTSPLITKCVVRENGNCGIYAYSSSSNPTVSCCNILNNAWGGFAGSKATLRNCIVAKNKNHGISGSSTVSVINCTVFGNTAGGVYNAGQIENCIIWGNGDDLYGSSATYSCIKDLDSGEGNIHREPMFENSDANDFHLKYSSPCINAGNHASDWSNEPGYPDEPNGCIDMGAYGNTLEATAWTDSDNDGMSDEWEIANGLDPDNANDSTEDLDGDGLRNIDEYWIGWDPNSNDSNSIFGLVHNDVLDINFPSVAKAVDWAENGETLILGQGTYYDKNINFNGKKIHVRSTDPNDPNVVAATIIDANDQTYQTTSCMTFDSGEDANTVVDGITLSGGYYGVYCKSASPLIENCRIVNNCMGIKCTNSTSGYSSPTVINCTITANTIRGIDCYGGSPSILRCRIIGNISYNLGHGIFYYTAGTGNATVKNCVIGRNKYGIGISGSSCIDIINCTIVYNTDYGISSSGATVKNCIIWGNNDDLAGSPVAEAIYSCIKNKDSGEGNIHRKPMFVNEDANDFHLYYSSPCVDSGDPNSDWFNEPDYDPNDPNDAIDMGAYGNTEEATPRTDMDADRMADEWELENGLDPNSANDAITDIDDDSLRNIDEYWCGWDPNSNDSNSISGLVHNDVLDINFPLVQLAVDWADNGETLILGQGTYYEKDINFNGKKIHVRSKDPNDPNVVAATIIDANDETEGSCIWFDSNEDADSVVDGLTLRGGYYGIWCDGSSPSIRNCNLVNNCYYGYCGSISGNPYSSPTIADCNVTDNWIGIWCGGGGPLISGCRIINNTNYGVGHWSSLGADTATIKNCVIARNNRGVSGSYIRVFNCTIAYNSIEGIWSTGGHAVAKNCILWGNGGNDFTGRLITYSCTEDGAIGWGNLNADPAFVNAADNDFHFSSWSRCIDAGDPNSDWSQEPGHPSGHIDMGAYGNTPEGATQTDNDGDGLPDEWEQHYWPGLEPNQVDPNGNLDNDGFSNGVEYLFGYDPNAITTASMTVIPFLSDSSQWEFIPFAWEDTMIDPTKDQTATISYHINMNADVDISFTKTNDPNNPVRTINQAAIAGVGNQAVWDGTDGGGDIVEKSFYDIKINASDGNGHSTSWTSPDGGNTLAGDTLYDGYPYPAIPVVELSDFDPYTNIPVEIQFIVNDWALLGVDIIKYSHPGYSDLQLAQEPEKYRIRHIVKNRLFCPGEQILYWDGRWGADVNDPNSGPDRKICQEAYKVFFNIATGVNRGSIVVYYEDALSNFKCNPYRVIPLHNEITTITYDLAYDANVTIDIYDPDGSLFRSLLSSEAQTQGVPEVVWDGKGDSGEYPSKEGIYLIEVKIDSTNEKLQGAVAVYR